MSSSSFKTLLIEDNPGDACLIAHLLGESGAVNFDLTHVETLNEAIQYPLRDCFDLILLDLSLPDSHGIETLISLQKQTGDLPIVVLTGSDDDDLALQALRLGAQDYLVKSLINPVWLKRTLSYATERAQLLRRLRQSETLLQELNDKLQERVDERTRELQQTNEQLQLEICQRHNLEIELRNSLSQAQELSELKSRIISTISHEYRTPLTIIFSSIEFLEYYGHQCSSEKREKYFKRIKSTVQHLTELVNDILLINQIQAEKIEVQPQPLNLLEFCDELVEIMANTSSKHTIIFSSQGDCSNACTDKKLLRQILTNLLTNAIKYSPQGGVINFEVICQSTQGIFCIEDNGIGMGFSSKKFSFSPFERGNNVSNIPGIGLGLAIVKKCVDLQAGKIDFDSKLGCGSTFRVTLPWQNKTLSK